MMIKKPTIAIDIDEVLFPMMDQFLAFHNIKYGTTLQKNDMKTYNVEDATSETQEVMLKWVPPYLKSEYYAAGRPIDGSVDTLAKLSKRYELIIITYRAMEYRGSTEAYLENYYPNLFRAVYYTHSIDAPAKDVSKYEIAKDVQAVAIVDDSLKTVSDCAVHGMYGVLFGDFPWNQTGKLPNGVTRCENWFSVLEYFDAI